MECSDYLEDNFDLGTINLQEIDLISLKKK